jgi:phosphatidylserine/phosphatidylglycerophosphate/cardiolipin synthase-like enzyme
MISLVTSANPHDGSSAHSNVALEISGDFWQSLWFSESAVAKMSHGKLQSPPIFQTKDMDNKNDNDISLELITEKKIKDSLLKAIKNTKKEDQISIAMFYLSERSVVKELIKAANRGVVVKIILDPNKDAFGYQKNGIPNRQVASELTKKSKGKIQIRWYNTSGEQFHSKLTYIAHKNGPSRLILGSANLTRRNINNYNLETNVSVIAPASSIFVQDIGSYFNRIWNNDNDNRYTLDYFAYQDDTLWKYWVYRLQEATGLCGF